MDRSIRIVRDHPRKTRRTGATGSAERALSRAGSQPRGLSVGRRRVGRGLVLGEDPVQAPSGVGQDGPGGVVGRRRSDAHDLGRGDAEFARERPDVVPAVVAATRPGAFGVERRRGRPTGVGQGEDAASFLLLGGDETLVLELLEGGVDGTGTRSPSTAGPLAKLGDELVAMHRLFSEEGQDGFADDAAPRLEPEAPMSAMTVVAMIGVIAATAVPATGSVGVGGVVVDGMRAASMGDLAVDSVEQRVIDPLGAGGGVPRGTLGCALSRYIAICRRVKPRDGTESVIAIEGLGRPQAR